MSKNAPSLNLIKCAYTGCLNKIYGYRIRQDGEPVYLCKDHWRFLDGVYLGERMFKLRGVR